MKKLLSAAMAAAILLSALSPAVMAQDSEMAEILKTVKERIEIPAELEKFESSSYENGDEGVTVYNFTWSSDDTNMSVSCTDSKIITSYDYYNYKRDSYDRAPAFPKKDKETLRAQAQSFVDRINPGQGIQVGEGEDSLYNYGTYFPVTREKNGVEVISSNGHVRFDSNNEEIIGFYISWPQIDEFEGGDLAIKSDVDVQKAFNDKLGFELVYRSYEKDREIIFYPAYIEKNSGKYIDAVTGEVFEPERDAREYFAGGGGDVQNAEMAAAKDEGFTPAENVELDKVAGLISKADIEKKVRANNVIEVPSEYSLVSISLSRNYYDENSYVYNMYFRSKDENKVISASADAKTGDIYGIGGYCEKSIAADEAVMTDALKKLAPSISEKYRFDGEKLSRYENGIRVLSDNAYVRTDEDGNIVSFDVSYTKKTEFPSVESAISMEEASAKIFEALDYTVKYFPQSDKKAYLAYSFDGDVNLNALTGKIVGYNNEETEDDAYTYADIDGHYAKDKIEKLAKYNIGFKGGMFKPDENITEADFDELMSNIFGRVIALRENTDYEEEKNEPITRETAAVMMIRAMGAEDYAKYNDIYIQPFKDVTENKGYISLLKAMGVVNGDSDGNFNPQNLLTRADAAILVYNYLNK